MKLRKKKLWHNLVKASIYILLLSATFLGSITFILWFYYVSVNFPVQDYLGNTILINQIIRNLIYFFVFSLAFASVIMLNYIITRYLKKYINQLCRF